MYTDLWADVESEPIGSSSLVALNPHIVFRRNALAIRERISDLLGISDFTVDPVRAEKLKSNDALRITNAADDKDFILVDDSGLDLLGQGRSIQFNAGNSGAAKALDLNDGNNQRLTLTANCILTLVNPKAGSSYVISIIQDGTGGRSLTFPASVRWPGGTAPALVTTANRVSLIGLYYTGAVYLGTLIGTNYNVL